MNKPVNPNFKEGVLTLCIVMPFIFLLVGKRIDNNDLFVAYGVDLVLYLMARVVYRQKVGTWRW